MASSPQASCLSDPNFAVICAFLERFAKSCGISYPTFVDLQEMLENVEQVSQELVDLHIKLLRKARKTVFLEKWEKALVKFCHTYSSQDGWEIERFGYKKSRLEVKLRALKMLLEGQFDLNSKFKASINTLESQELRSKPLGKDKLGRLYWLQFDAVSNIRVYREDHDEDSWTLVAQDRSSLVNLLHELSGDEFPLDLNIISGDNVILEIDKPLTDTGQESDLSAQQNVNSECNNSSVSENNNIENSVVDTSENSNSESNKMIVDRNSKVDKETKEKCKTECQDNLPVHLKNGESKPDSEETNSLNKSDLSVECNTILDSVKDSNIDDGVIEEPVMYISGSGSGEDCMTGNPDMVEDQSEKESEDVNQEKISDDQCKISNQSSSDLDNITDVNVDKQKTAPKLWSIDTICGVNSSKTNADSMQDEGNVDCTEIKVKQRNFSSFSIDSVLEKKDLSTSDHFTIPKLPVYSNDSSYEVASSNNKSKEAVKYSNITQLTTNSEVKIENLSTPSPTLESTMNMDVDLKEDCNEKNSFSVLQTDSELTGESGEVSVLHVTALIENKKVSIEGDDSDETANAINSEIDSNKEELILKNEALLKSENESAKSECLGPSVSIDKESNEDSLNNTNETSANDRVVSSVKDSEEIFPAKERLKSLKEKSNVDSDEPTVPVPVEEKLTENETSREAKLAEENKSESSETPIESVSEISKNLSQNEDDDSQKCEMPEVSNTISSASSEKYENATVPINIDSTDTTTETSDYRTDDTEKMASTTLEVGEETQEISDVRSLETNQTQENVESNSNMDVDIDNKENEKEQISSCSAVDTKEPSESECRDEKNAISNEKEVIIEKTDSNLMICESTVDENSVKENTFDEGTSSQKDKFVEEEEDANTSSEQKQNKKVISQRKLSRNRKTTEEDAKTDDKVREDKPEKTDENSSVVKKEELCVKEEDKMEELILKNDIKEEAVVKLEKKEEDPWIKIEEKEEESEIKVGKKKEEPEFKIGKKDEEWVAKEDEQEEELVVTENKAEEEMKVKKEEPEEESAVKDEKEEEEDDDEVDDSAADKSQHDSQGPKISTDNDDKKGAVSSSVGRGRGYSKRRRRRRNRDKFKKKKPEFSETKKKNEEEEGGSGEKEDIMEESKKGTDEVADENTSKKKGRPKKNEGNNRTPGRPIASREIKLLGISDIDVEVPSIRQSRRIAQMKMKEEAERRRVEALQLETFKKKKKSGKLNKKKSKKNADSDSYDDKGENDDDESDDLKLRGTKEKRGRRKKKKDKLVFDELNPWLSSSGSSTADEEEDEIEEEPHEEEELVFKSDHEFSPESDVEDPDYKPMKRARTAKVEESTEAAGKYDDTSCEKCGNNDHPEWILLCDRCDKGWHASCLRPALMLVPEGDWFCPPCEHTALIEKLQQSLVQYDRNQKQRENEELRKKRLAFVGISLDNVLPPTKKSKNDEASDAERSTEEDSESGSESGSDSEESESNSEDEPVYRLRERRSNMTSYRYNEYDELIKSALQDEMEAVKGAGNAGRGKDISNIVNAEKHRDCKEDLEQNLTNEIPCDRFDETPNEKNTASGETKSREGVHDDEDEHGDTNEEKDSEGEDDENLIDEIPAVVPKYAGKKKKSKSVKITSLDFTSEEEDNNSDSDFKGVSSEEESDYSLPSESESSDDVRRKRGGGGPLRRSTRARVSRYDRDFINDDSDDSPKRKKNKRDWDSFESSDSDRSWGRKKKRTNRFSQRSTAKRPGGKGKKKKSRRHSTDSGREGSATPRKQKNRKIKYGGLDMPDEDTVLTRRTRGKKINYQEITGSDSEVDGGNRKGRGSRVIESDDDFVAEKDEELQAESEDKDSGEEEEELDSDEEIENFASEKKRGDTGKKKLLEKIKEKKWVIPDPDDFSENDLMEDEQLDKVAEELDNLNEDEEEILEKILESGDVPIRDLKAAVNRAKKEKETEVEDRGGRAQMEDVKFKMSPLATSGRIKATELPEANGGFRKVENARMTPGLVAEMPMQQAAMVMSVEPKPFIHGDVQGPADIKFNLGSGFPFKTAPGDGRFPPESLGGNLRPPNDPSFEDASSIRPPRLLADYAVDAHSNSSGNIVTSMNSRIQTARISDREFGSNAGPPTSEFPGFRGITSPSRVPACSPSLPITVAGMSNINSEDFPGEQGSKSSAKMKRKLDQVSSPSENTSESEIVFSPRQGDEFSHLNKVQGSPPKKKGRGRGKKQSLPEGPAQNRVPGLTDGATGSNVGLHQASIQFPAKPLPAEGQSVITRILNSPQGAFPIGGDPTRFPVAARSRPSFAPFPGSPRPLSGLRLRHPGPGGTIFHGPHPLDPSPSGGGPINLPISNSGITKPVLAGPLPAFSRPSVLSSRFPSDPAGRQVYLTRNSPPRPDFSFPSYYGSFQPGGNTMADAAHYQSPAFQEQPFGEESAMPGNGKQFDDETGGEFGGLASYFASQREDDLDT